MNNSNQIQEFNFVTYIEDEDGACQTILTSNRTICPALSWTNRVLYMEELYGDDHVLTKLLQ